MAQELWDRLRTTGLQDLAPTLFEHGVRELKDILPNAGALLLRGVEAWKLEAIVRGRLETSLALPAGRPDHPTAEVRQKASWTAALEAALPQNRQASLEALQAAVLAATTRPAVESRLRAWRELSAAWERPPFPVDAELVRCVGASLRAGGYHSCSMYFAAATSHQLRTLALPIGEETRFIIRDTVRAIKRGLGPARLKDAFDFEVLRSLVHLEEALRAFDERDLAAAVDLCIICTWYMLRKIEISNARAHHLYLAEPDVVHLLLPVSKTESQGCLTVRSYICVCRARAEPLCPYHTARNLERLRLAGVDHSATNFLFPGPDGQPLKKYQVVQLIERADEAGRQVLPFHRLLTRPSPPPAAGLESRTDLGPCCSAWCWQRPRCGRRPDVLTERSEDAPPAPDGDGAAVTLDQVRAEIAKAIPVRETLIVQPRRRVAHSIGVPETHNEVCRWRTTCGWGYGWSAFYRVQADSLGQELRRCRRCFPEEAGWRLVKLFYQQQLLGSSS